MNKRDIVRANREAAIREMAMRRAGRPAGDPDESELARARTLYTACIRYGCAQGALVETETEDNWNMPSRLRKERELERRYDSLQERLAEYGLRLWTPHIWPDLRKAGHGPVVDAGIRLHYFD